jgi:serine/threonine protein kinase
LQIIYIYIYIYRRHKHTHAYVYACIHTHTHTYRNVFVDKDMVAKVADFGLCTNQATSSDAAGTPQWAAPEVLRNLLGQRSTYDKSSDVYRHVCICAYI